MPNISRALSVIGVLALGAVTAEAQFDFEDIRFWTGEGPNRAALVIDWSDETGSGGSAVWGYRWQDGESPTGADLLTAVLEADPSLFARVDSGADPNLVFGLGYDVPGSDPFALDGPISFNTATGIAATSTPSAPALDPAESIDRYQEGFGSVPTGGGFWHYGLADASPYVAASEGGGEWVSSNVGLAGRALSDAVWDAWTFEPTPRFMGFPDQPVAAPAPGEEATLAGDYNRDGTVDAADYTLWRDSLGSSTEFLSQGADGDADGRITELDFIAWIERFGDTATGAEVPLAIPEPAAATLILFLVFTLRCRAVR